MASDDANELMVAAEMAEANGARADFVLGLFLSSGRKGNLYSKLKAAGYIEATGQKALSVTAQAWLEELAGLGDSVSQLEFVASCRTGFFDKCDEKGVSHWLLSAAQSGYVPAVRRLVCERHARRDWTGVYPWLYLLNMNDLRAHCGGSEVTIAEVTQAIDDPLNLTAVRQAATFLYQSIRTHEFPIRSEFAALRLEAYKSVTVNEQFGSQ